MKILGIDVGTGGTRAVVIDDGGRVVASSTEEHVPFASPRTGWAQQDPRDWWRASTLAIRSVLAGSKCRPDEIRGVGLTGQMHGTVLLDGAGDVLRPALIWCDQRTDEQCRIINERLGEQRVIQLTLNPALTNFSLTKMLWVREHEPDLWLRARSFLLPKDYVRFRLTGDKATDVSDASGTLMLDVAARQWSREMLQAFELDEELLPRVFESAQITGTISAEGAEATGLPVGLPVVGGAGDQAAGAIGMGIVQPGMVSATIGTSGVVFAATSRPALDPGGRVHTFCHAVTGRWHVMGVTQAAGLSLRWLREILGVESGAYETLTREASMAPVGSDGVLWLPYLMGERTPHLDPHARAALTGLAANHTRGHIVRAVLEGVAFSLRDTLTIFEEMKVPVERIRLGGGGARSKLWRQIQADVYGQTVEIVEAEEGAAYGAAILAGVGSGIWPDVDAACDLIVRVAERIDVDDDALPVMKQRYDAYRRLYPALRDAR